MVRVCPNQIFLRTRQPKMGWQTIVRSVTKKEDANPVGGITQQGVKATLKMSDFDDNMLFAELRRRGYTGELRYSKVVNI